MSIKIFSILTISTLVFSSSFAEESSYESESPAEEMTEEFEEKEVFAQRISLSHAEGSGLGYSIGYSSLDLFLSKSFGNQTFVPFLDLRGHVFNNGRYAGNAALGLRYFDKCFEQIWGINVAYDYLQHLQNYPHRSYHQVGGGFEFVRETWDFRLNAYIPVGHKKTNIYRFNYAFYEDLKRNDLTPFKLGLKAREQLTLNGVDSLFGYRLGNFFCTDWHVSAGPYYYWGRTKKTTNAFTKKFESSC